MNYLDYIIILIVLIGFALGFKDGLVRKIIGLLGFIVGIALAFEFSNDVGLVIVPVINNDLYLAEIIAGIIIFLSVMLIVTILKRVIHPLDKVNRFVNQLLGGISGMLQMLFFISGLLLFLNIFNLPGTTDRKDSFLYDKTYKIIPNTLDLIMGTNSKAKGFIKSYIESKDDTNIDTLQTD